MTLYTSVTEKQISRAPYSGDCNYYSRTGLVYLIISVFLAFAGAVYEHFSFGVYSYYMIYAFAIPLIGGTLLCMLMDKNSGDKVSGGCESFLWHAGIATLTAGSIIKGILAICGRPNSLVNVYPAAGLLLLGISVMIYIIRNRKRK